MKKEIFFANRQAFRAWLGQQESGCQAVWLLFDKRKKTSTLTANEALEEAMCYGWIDGLIQSVDENTYRKYFAPRLPKSKWSVKNRQLALELIEKGLMTAAGIEAVERAKQNGLWDSNPTKPFHNNQIDSFLQMLSPYESAYSNLQAMPSSVKRTYAAFYLDAKTDKTRHTRLEKIVDRLNKNLKPM